MRKYNYKVGNCYYNNEGSKFTIIEYNNYRDVLIRFDDQFSHEVKTSCNKILSGTIKNPYHKSIANIGFMGYGSFKSRINKKRVHANAVWVSMITRCYDKKYQVNSPTYKDCVVCDDWHNYQNFAKWYTENEYYGLGYELDKDLLFKGNRIYSPETCVLIPRELNTCLLYSINRSDNGLPMGVSKVRDRYTASISIEGKTNFIGYFSTIMQASDAYNEAKKQNIRRLAYKYMGKIDKRVFDTLLNWNPEQ